MQKDYRGMPADWLSSPESTGAAAGAGLAVWHTFKRDGKMMAITRFFSGYWFGYLGAQPLLKYLAWDETEPMRMFAASVIGLIAFIVVQAVLAEGTRKIAQKGAQAVIGKITGVKSES